MKTQVNIDKETRRKIIDLRSQHKKKIEYEIYKGAQNSHGNLLPNVKAYKLFDEGKSPLEVATELNLPGPQVQQFYVEYWKLKHMHQLFNVYQEIQNSIGYFLKLFRLGKKEGLTSEQVINLIKMSDNIHELKRKISASAK